MCLKHYMYFIFNMLTAKILFIIFYLCIPVIFFDFLDLTAAAAGSFLRYLDRVQKSYF